MVAMSPSVWELTTVCTTPVFDAVDAVDVVDVVDDDDALDAVAAELLLVVGAVALLVVEAVAADVDAAEVDGLSVAEAALLDDVDAAAVGAGEGFLQPWVGISSFWSICSRSSSSTRSGLLLSTISFQPGTSPLPRPNLTATPESVSPG